VEQVGTLGGEPLDAEAMGARGLAEAFVARSRLRGWLFVLGGLVLAIGCLAGFGYFGDKQDAVGQNGVHATATVTSAALYGGPYGPNSFSEHIDVEFSYPGGRATGVRIYIGENDRYRVGQQVEIVYDRAHPHRAVLAHGYRDIGPVGFPLFFGIVFGLVLVVVGVRDIRLARGARRALQGEARTMQASSELVPSGRARRLALTLRGGDGGSATLWSARRHGWSSFAHPVDATVFGSTAPGSATVVVDPARSVVTMGRVWKPPWLPHLPRVPHALVPVLFAAVVAVGVGATVVAAIWTVRLVGDSQESNRIQAGPRVLATIVSTGKPSGTHQDVKLGYTDLTGATHELRLRYPLGIGGSVIPGMTTTVSYDPSAPQKAELAGHPRHQWQTALLAGAATLGLTVLWLAIAASLRRARDEAHGHRGHVFASVGGVIVLIGAVARVLIALVVNSTPQEVAFPPNAPALALGRAAPLPRVLSLAPPASGLLVTPPLARRIVSAVWPLRDRALANRDLATVRALESGPALAVDVARMRSGGAPNRPTPDRAIPAGFRVYVPRQSSWPARFLAEVPTTTDAQPWLEMLIFTRASAHSHWQVVYDTGFGAQPGGTVSPEPGNFDEEGYDEVPAGEIPADDAVPNLGRYWQAWRDDPNPPAAVPPWAPGTWTTEYGRSVADRQNQVGDNGLPEHIAYGDKPAPAGELWTFGVWNEELVCSPMHQTTTWTGPAGQDANRQKWGPDLAPGVYRTVTADILREACVLVPRASGQLVAFGADRVVIHLTGVRSSG
jgi:uncharacterized protein DUF3592